ncbi:uncharacterized protein [Struthio camelus]|uniref:uncharacterized protein isoform X11 n=1 Tax=Struthio camelus TaxID=8801 RepID=UPI003603EF67
MAPPEELTAVQLAQLTFCPDVFSSVADIEEIFDRLPKLPGLNTSTEHQESDNLVAKFLLLTIRYLLAGSTRRTPGSFLLQLLSKGEGKLSPPQLVSLTLQSSAFNEEEEMCQILAKLHNNPTEEIHQYSDQFNREAAQTKAATKENTYNTSSQLFSQSVPMPVRKT